MPKYIFKILCADDNDSCRAIQELMNDFKIKPSKLEGYHHIAEKDFDNPDKAAERVLELKHAAGKKIINIVAST